MGIRRRMKLSQRALALASVAATLSVIIIVAGLGTYFALQAKENTASTAGAYRIVTSTVNVTRASSNNTESYFPCENVNGTYGSYFTPGEVDNKSSSTYTQYYFSQSLVSCTRSSIINSEIASSSSLPTLTFTSCATILSIQGNQYCALNVANYIELGNPGYTVFNRTKTISFDGVTFRALCPSGYSGCPNTSGNRTTVTLSAGLISLDLIFKDGTRETIGNILMNGEENLTILSAHKDPRAGVLIEPNLSGNGYYSAFYYTFLLVQVGEQQQAYTSHNSEWAFKATIKYYGSPGSSFSVVPDHEIDVDANLTYVGNHNRTVDMVNPLLAGSVQLFEISPVNGSLVGLWAYMPSVINGMENISLGQSFYDKVSVPYAALQSGHRYIIEVEPAIAATSSNDAANLSISFNFAIS